MGHLRAVLLAATMPPEVHAVAEPPTPRVPMPQQLDARWQGLFAALNHENDFICAVAVGSYVEHCLRCLLQARLVDGNTSRTMIDPVKGLLGSLQSAANFAYCIGAITKEMKQDIERVGKVRNLFAHSIDELSFSSDSVAAECQVGWSVHSPLGKTG